MMPRQAEAFRGPVDLGWKLSRVQTLGNKGLIWEAETCGQDADDGVGVAIKLDGFSHDGGIGAEFAAPQRIAENDGERAAGFVFFGKKRSAQRRLDAQNRKEIPGHSGSLDAFGFPGACEIGLRAGAEGEHAYERVIVCLPVAIFRVGNGPIVEPRHKFIGPHEA